MLRKIWFKSLVVIISCVIVFSICALGLSKKQVSGKTNTSMGLTVVIDAGHGGIDGGAVGKYSGICERDINLAVAMKLKDYFENVGINVVLTRTTPAGLYGIFSQGFKRRDLLKRAEITNASDANAFISIHMNKFTSASKRGSQVFFKDDEQSISFANYMQAELDKVDFDNRKGIVKEGDYYVLNSSKIPSILCECGYLSNPDDEKELVTDEYQAKLAYAIYLGSINYFYNSAQIKTI